jgi:hypothetical protein
VSQLFSDLEDEVKEAIAAGTRDVILNMLLEVTMASLVDERPLFANIIDEPLFYRRYFLPWVREGLQELRTIENASREAFETLTK